MYFARRWAGHLTQRVFAAFDHTQIPLREWVKTEALDNVTCNAGEPSIRSLLALDWVEQGAPAINYDRAGAVPAVQLKPYLPTSPIGLHGFTCFSAKYEEMKEKPRLREHGVAQGVGARVNEDEEDLERCGLMPLLEMQLHIDWEEKYYARASETVPFTRHMLKSQEQRYQNVLGPLPIRDEHVARAVVDILGAGSDAGTSSKRVDASLC